jgi:folate-binding protein YgfZ
MLAATLHHCITLDDYGLFIVKGPDARKFLQGQVTCDINRLAINQQKSQTTLGAHCTHKGRMLFSFRACALACEENGDTIALRMYKTLIPSALAALKKYSIFSKVELYDGSNDYQLFGATKTQLGELSSLFPILPESKDQARHSSGGIIIAIGDDRYECWLNQEQANALRAQSSVVANQDLWCALNIIDGLGEVRPETVEEFIPQMLNLQLIGEGISFKKGCYTGQEVVARMQYLGKLKRRLYRFSCASTQAIPAGLALYAPGHQQSIGTVVISAPVGEQQQLLAVVTEEAAMANQVHIDPDCKEKLEALPLPYAITKE